MSKAFSLCGTLDEVKVLCEEIAFFQAVKAVIAKASNSDKKLAEDLKNQILKRILYIVCYTTVMVIIVDASKSYQ